MTKGLYTKPTGEIIEVLDVDPINRMVYVQLPNLTHTWIHDTEYNEWTIQGGGYGFPEEEAAPQIVVEEEAKKKRTTKKKEA